MKSSFKLSRVLLRVLLRALLVLLASSIFSAAASAAASAVPPAKEIVCRTCHGDGGAKTLLPSYPKLDGQNKEYLVQVLGAYKKGERKGGMAPIMTAQAAVLSDAEIAELATYYSSQP
jgi:cytochrome c